MSGPKVSVEKIDKLYLSRRGEIDTRNGDIYCYMIKNITLDETGVIDVPALVKNVSVPGNNKEVPTIIYLSKEAAKNIRNVQSVTPVYLRVEGDMSLLKFKGHAVILGGPEKNTFVGNDGDNVLYGVDGADVLEGLGGADELNGGSRSDTASYESSPAGVRISLGAVIRQLKLSPTGKPVNLMGATASGGHAQGDKLYGIENIIGSSFNDVLAGDYYRNTLIGNAGNDTLIGGKGEDLLIGGDGNDTYVVNVGTHDEHDEVEIEDDKGSNKIIFQFQDSKDGHSHPYNFIVEEDGVDFYIYEKENFGKRNSIHIASIENIAKVDALSKRFSFYARCGNGTKQQYKINPQQRDDGTYRFFAVK